MLAVSSFNSIDSLRDWFYSLNGVSYWTIYKGPEKKVSERIMSYSYETVEGGWEKMSTMISNLSMGGGTFTIYCGKGERDAAGFTVRFSSNPMMASMRGIDGGFNGTGESIKEIVALETHKAIEEYKKDLRIEQLEGEIEDLKKGRGRAKGIQATINGIGDMLENNPTLVSLLSPIITAIAGKLMGGQTPQMAMNGIQRPIQMEGIESDSENPDEYSEEEMAKLFENLTRIEATLEQDPLELLEKLANFCDKNPAMAKSLLTNLN